MLCFMLVCALVLPSLAIAQDAIKEKPKISCNNSGVTNAGDAFLSCFSNVVMHSVNKRNSTCDTLEGDLKEYSKVANQSCYNDTASGEEGVLDFLDLVRYSIRNGQFADFVNNSGVRCIDATKKQITECVKKQVGSIGGSSKNIPLSRYDILWRLASTNKNQEACKHTMKIKQCALDEMWSQYELCSENNILYVNSLFEFMLDRCSRAAQSIGWDAWMNRNEDDVLKVPPFQVMGKEARTTHALLGVLLALAILAIFYVCVRDCRAPRGQWKALNERISMSIINRRRSLVHSEAGQTTNQIG